MAGQVGRPNGCHQINVYTTHLTQQACCGYKGKHNRKKGKEHITTKYLPGSLMEEHATKFSAVCGVVVQLVEVHQKAIGEIL